LKLPLLFIASVDGERNRLHHRSIARDLGPEMVVVEMAREALPGRVVDILHVDEDRHGLDGFHRRRK
jgi:hypothetical protein